MGLGHVFGIVNLQLVPLVLVGPSEKPKETRVFLEEDFFDELLFPLDADFELWVQLHLEVVVDAMNWGSLTSQG